MEKRELKPGWLTGRDEISRYLGWSKRKVSREIATGRIPHTRPNHKTLMVRVTDLDKALAGIASVEVTKPTWLKREVH